MFQRWLTRKLFVLIDKVTNKMNNGGGGCALTSWGTGHPVPRHSLLLVCLISGAGSANPRAEIFHLLELIILSSDYFSTEEKTRATAMQTPAPRVRKIWWGQWGLWHTSGPDVLGCLSGFVFFVWFFFLSVFLWGSCVWNCVPKSPQFI